MGRFKKSAIIVATQPIKEGSLMDYCSTSRTYRVLGRSGSGIRVEDCHHKNVRLFGHKFVNESQFINICNIPTICKKVWKSFVQLERTVSGDGTYMAENQGYIHILYVTDSHMFCINKYGYLIILDSRFNLRMFEECKAPKIDYAWYAREMRMGNLI